MLRTVYVVSAAGSPGPIESLEEVQQKFSDERYLSNRVDYFKANWHTLRAFTSKAAALEMRHLRSSLNAVFTMDLPATSLVPISETELKITSAATFADIKALAIQEISFGKITFGKEMVITLSNSRNVEEKETSEGPISSPISDFSFAPST